MAQLFLRASLESEEFSTEHLQVRKVDGSERIGQPFDFSITVIWVDASGAEIPTVKEVVGCGATLVFLESDDGTTWASRRSISGIVASAGEHLDSMAGGVVMTLRLVPRAHRLTLVETQEVFLDRTLPQIFEQKLAGSGLSVGADVQFRLSATYPQIDFLVQYRESDLALLQRLSEHHGISITFEQDDGHDVIVFTDKQSAFPKVDSPGDSLELRGSGQIGAGAYEVQVTEQVIPSVYVHMDYNYRTPQLDLTSQQTLPDAYGGGVVEYGSHYRTSDEGQAFAQIRSEEHQSTETIFVGKSGEPQLRPGATTALTGYMRFDGQNLLITEVMHSIDQVVGTHSAHSGSDGQHTYRNSFKAVPASQQFRPPRVTPRPRIHGLVHAVIDPLDGGAIGEFARIDTTGRYTVRFFFDTAGSSRPVSSKRLRMLQQHAGTAYGTHMPLKPGIEVLVAFVDGDPDRPIIVGAVHNPLTPSPVQDANSTMNRMKTVSGILVEMKDRG